MKLGQELVDTAAAEVVADNVAINVLYFTCMMTGQFGMGPYSHVH